MDMAADASGCSSHPGNTAAGNKLIVMLKTNTITSVFFLPVSTTRGQRLSPPLEKVALS